jgi:hypothetical protein
VTKVQRILLIVGTAVGFQLATIAATFDAEAVTDWQAWLVSVLAGAANAAGVAIIATRTAGGLSVPVK